MRRIVIGLLMALVLQGCADMGIENPFSSGSSDVNEVYYDQFPDIPIPRDLSVDRKRSLVSVTHDGSKAGLVTTEGRLEMLSLTSAMIHNMSGQGWALRSSTTGPRMIQVYEKDNRFAVLYYYEQTMSAAMEIWVGSRLQDGVVPVQTGSGSMNPDGSYSGAPMPGDPGYIEPSYGSSSQALTQ